MRRARIATLHAPLDVSFLGRPPFETTHQRRDIANLIKLLVRTQLPDVGNREPKRAVLESLTGGRSGAFVFKLTSLLSLDGPCISAPRVIKISPLDKGACEKANYDQFVRPFLPETLRPDLLGFAISEGRAALCYSFVGGDGGVRPETLTDRLQVGHEATLDYILSNIFDSLPFSWYSPQLTSKEPDIALLYLDRYFEGLPKAADAEKTLVDCITRYFGAKPCGGGYMVGKTSFPSPYKLLFSGNIKRPCYSCIQHGDLNTDNIIINRDRYSARLIDFERTGRGHVYQDLVSLEPGIRINFPADASFKDIWELERLIALEERQFPAHSYAAAILKVRDAAYRYFGRIEDPTTYQFAAAAIGLRLMQATDLSDSARARISASVLWAAKAISGGNARHHTRSDSRWAESFNLGQLNGAETPVQAEEHRR